MSDTPWVDALRAAHSTRAGASRLLKSLAPVTVREWYGAVLMDGSGLLPEDLLQGSTVISHDDATVTGAVTECLRRIYGDGTGLLLIGYGRHTDSYDRAVNVGIPVVVVTWDRQDFVPPEAVLLADRDVALGEACEPDIVSSLVEAVTGAWVEVRADDAQYLTPDQLLRCVHLGSTADDCRERIATIVGLARGGRDEEAKKVPDDPVADMIKRAVGDRAKDADATPVAAVAHDVVRKLSEMAGYGEAQEWGVNLGRDLRDYKAGRLAWADVDRGVLLSGPPGGGKTTFARALAMECEVALVVTTYSEWSSAAGTHGDSMSKGINKLFADWRKKAENGPYILFIDEIDSMGKRGGNAQNDSWFGPIINAWLAFLDGATPRDGIVVVAATNHPERVDQGMLRPGRLDRHVELPMPDVAALAAIIRAHLGPDAVLTDEEVAEAARAVRGKSPADVQLLAREARRIARWCKRRVCASDLTDVVAMRRREEDPATTRRVAVHEAGHAVVGVLLDGDVLECVDLDAGKATFLRPPIATPRLLEARMTMMLAARAAEEMVLGEVSSGCGVDLEQATALAHNMRGSWGMGDGGLVSLDPATAVHDPRHLAWVRRTLDAAYARAVELVTGSRGAVERVADALVRQRYLDAGEVRALVAGPVVTPRVRRTAPMMGGAVKRVVGPKPGAGPG